MVMWGMSSTQGLRKLGGATIWTPWRHPGRWGASWFWGRSRCACPWWLGQRVRRTPERSSRHTRWGSSFQKRKSKDGWPHLAGEIISALFARNQKQLLFPIWRRIFHKTQDWICSVGITKITLDVYDVTYYILLCRVLPQRVHITKD